jgi:hypothetical protein
VISIMIPQVHGAKGNGAHLIAPLSNVRDHLSAILYVDDTSLLHLNLDGDENTTCTQPYSTHSRTGANCLLQRGYSTARYMLFSSH